MLEEDAHRGSSSSIVPPLTILDRKPSVAERELESAPRRVWTDPDGVVCAYGYTAAGQHLMQIPGVGSFAFGQMVGHAVTVRLSDSIADNLLLDTYRRMVVPMVLQVRGREVLHASAIQWGSRVAAFCAVSGTGKSTLAYGMSLRGHRLWADDVVVVEVADRITALPLPFRVRLTAESASLLVGGEHEGKQALGNLQRAARPSALAAILLLERGRGQVQRVHPPTSAFPALLAHAYNFDAEDRERKRLTVEQYLALVARVPIFTFPIPAGLTDLQTTLDRLESTLVNLPDGSQ